MLNLYFIQGNSEACERGDWDLLVRAKNAYKATQYWRKYFNAAEDYFPVDVRLIPVIGKKGAIDWHDILPQDFSDPNNK